jgi:hypothetical protein
MFAKELARIAPFPSLKPFAMIFEEASVDLEPVTNADFAFNAGDSTWGLSDGLLFGFWRAAEGNQLRLRQLIRLFLLHEYIHSHHCIGKFSAPEVGKFQSTIRQMPTLFSIKWISNSATTRS